MEQLVKVAHAIEQQHAGMLGLDAQVLLHHRRVGGGIGSQEAGATSLGSVQFYLQASRVKAAYNRSPSDLTVFFPEPLA
jgi:hypothetical protein